MKLSLPTIFCCACAVLAVGQEPPPPPQTPPPPTAPATPTAPKPVVDITATKKAAPPSTERDTGGDALSIEPFYWMTREQPRLRTGAAYASTYIGNLNLTGDKNYADGAIVTIPTGHENSLQFTYVRRQSAANVTLGNYYTFFADDFTTGDVVATHYTMQNLKLSWNYLTYPFPSAGAKFRLKTLYEVQWVDINSSFDAPADVNATTTQGRRDVILPTLGLGIEYHPVRNVRFEVKGSGFGIPHHSDIYDAEASLVVRVTKIEVSIGAKAFHYKTSPQQDQSYNQTMLGPYAGIKWIFK